MASQNIGHVTGMSCRYCIHVSMCSVLRRASSSALLADPHLRQRSRALPRFSPSGRVPSVAAASFSSRHKRTNSNLCTSTGRSGDFLEARSRGNADNDNVCFDVVLGFKGASLVLLVQLMQACTSQVGYDEDAGWVLLLWRF